MPRCPTCKKEAKPRAGNPAFPFCSERCKAIDLGKWFNGEYRVARPLQDGEQASGGAQEGPGDTDEDRGGN